MTARWRVGTLSMGLCFLTVGLLIFIMQFTGKEISGVFRLWWPILFVLLGGEILLYLFFSRKEQTVIKYDVFSIFIVGAAGFLCLVMLVLTSTGLLKEMEHAFQLVDAEREVSSVELQIPAHVNRVVVHNDERHLIYLEKEKTETLHIFGVGHVKTRPEEARLPIPAKEVVTLETVGNTLFVTVKGLPEKHGLVHEYARLQLTMVVPEHLDVEGVAPVSEK